MLRKLLKREVNRPLSNEDLHQLADCNVIEYSQLADCKDIEDLVSYEKPLIILIETAVDSGHWTLLMEKKDGAYEYFDSYAGKPDEHLKWAPQHIRELEHEDVPHLTDLLAGHKVLYNKTQLQEDDTSTCGRWCIARIALRKWPIKKFVDAFHDDDSSFTPDELVTLMTLLRGSQDLE